MVRFVGDFGRLSIGFRDGEGRRRGEGLDGFLHLLPLVEGVDEVVFALDGGDGVEKELADVGEGSGVAVRDAVLGDGGIELAEDMVDVGGGHEIAGNGGGEFGAERSGFTELEFGTSMEWAEGEVAGMAKHAAAATVGEREFAELRFVRGEAGASGLA